MKIVISQSMYFPWIGLLEQVKIADVFVHYNDVQYSKGFLNRVQIKSESGVRWLTVPLCSFRRGQLINEVRIDESKPWRETHRRLLKEAYRKAPFLNDMLGIVDKVFNQPSRNLSDLSKFSILALSDFFDLSDTTVFLDSEELNLPGKSSQRLCKIVLKLGGKTYVTGHGAKNYLDYTLFEGNNIDVRFMDYKRLAYPQLNGEFTPFVSALDLIANCGKSGGRFIQSKSLQWKTFIQNNNELS